MTKRYFERKWGEEYYIFDSETITEEEFDEKVQYQDYRAFADSMQGSEIEDRLNYLQHCKDEADKLIAEGVELAKENRELRQDNQKLRIQRHEDVNYLAKIAMEYKAINEIFKKSLKESKHTIEYETIVKMGKKIGVEWK